MIVLLHQKSLHEAHSVLIIAEREIQYQHN